MTEASCIDRSSGAAGLPDTSKTNTTNKSTTTNTTAADKPSLVIIGNGMAPGRMLEHLIENGNPYDVTIFNAEPRVNYNRLMLSYVLDGNKTYDDIITHGEDWYIEHGITLHTHTGNRSSRCFDLSRPGRCRADAVGGSRVSQRRAYLAGRRHWRWATWP